MTLVELYIPALAVYRSNTVVSQEQYMFLGLFNIITFPHTGLILGLEIRHLPLDGKLQLRVLLDSLLLQTHPVFAP